MFAVKVKTIIKIMGWVRRVSFIVCMGGLLFFAYSGYKGIEYQLTASGMTALMVVPLLMLFVSGRWWERLAGKKYIKFSFKNKRVNKDGEIYNYMVEKEEVFNSEIVHI